ncbi:ras-like protein rasG [Mercenaria mercenaria]|uniref:ras-like protein rasG n=1 Tax=Mercenaria mercenaria TaxID=6596 RepID=UPI00234F6E39|nr:ras-like protein rasG [Mercenaria mercenaria]
MANIEKEIPKIDLAVLGSCNSGKTALCKRFAKLGYEDFWNPTIFDDFTCTFEYGEEQYEVNILDTAGNEDFLTLTKKVLNDRSYIDGILCVYDASRVNNWEEAEFILEMCYTKTLIDRIGDHGMMIVGNKCDLERKGTFQGGEKLAQKYGAYFFKVSAKTNANVQEAFYTLCRDAVYRKYGKKKDKTTRIFQRLLQPIYGAKTHAATSVPEEFQPDPYALHVFERALRDGKEKDRSIRINIVGNYRQGKTSLVRRLLGKKVTDVSSTDGIDVIHYNCHRTEDGKLSLKKNVKKS